MHVTRRRICCSALNAYRPSSALQSIFLDGKYVRHASSSDLPLEIEVGLDIDQLPPKRDKSFIESTSLSKTLENLRKENRTPKPKQENKHAEFMQRRSHLHPGSSVDAEFRRLTLPETATDEEPLAQLGNRAQVPVSGKLAHIAQKKQGTRNDEVLEYEGKYVKPIKGTQRKETTFPWMEALKGRVFENSHAALAAEIESFGKWMRPTEAEIAARESVIEEVSAVVQSICPDYSTEPFGSSRNGLGLASSDIDIRLYKEESESHARLDMAPRRKTQKENLRQLRRLHRHFDSHHGYLLCNLRRARYPLLHMQHKASGIDVQVVCANDTSKQRARISKYLEQSPHLFDLYAILKTTLDMRGLCDVYRGGLGSYSLLNMIRYVSEENNISARKGALELPLNGSDHPRPLDLMVFLRTFGPFLDTYRYMLQIEPPLMHPKTDDPSLRAKADDDAATTARHHLSMIDHSQPYLLCMQDPEDPTNDLGRQAYGWKHIQTTLTWLEQKMQQDLKNFTKNPSDIPFLFPLVARCANAYEGRRAIAAEYGTPLLLDTASGSGYPDINLRFDRPVDQMGKRGRLNLDASLL